MSSPLAIAAVTAALKDMLNDGLLNHDLSAVGNFSVTAMPPDRVDTGPSEPNRLNVFLYQVTPNLGWRNVGLSARDAGGARTGSPPLALDLHYLLTAYGAKDMNAEVLLGYAMQILHENPVLPRDRLRIALGGPSPVDGTILPAPFGNLSAADLADQAELIKLSPVFLNAEELSKLWTAMQARYRPTMAYMASVVLIQSKAAGKAAPPVLKRGTDDRGPVAFGSPSPTLAGVRPAVSDLLPAMRLGDDLLATGTHFDAAGAITALFEHVQSKAVRSLVPAPGTSPSQLMLHVPSIAEDADAMHEWAVGFYTLSLRVAPPNSPAWITNGVPAALAPLVEISPLGAQPGDIDITLTCTPRLLPEQEKRAVLIFGQDEIIPQTVTTPPDPLKPTTLEFHIPAVAKGEYLVRLRVDGIDSLPVRQIGSLPQWDFAPQQKVTVA